MRLLQASGTAVPQKVPKWRLVTVEDTVYTRYAFSTLRDVIYRERAKALQYTEVVIDSVFSKPSRPCPIIGESRVPDTRLGSIPFFHHHVHSRQAARTLPPYRHTHRLHVPTLPLIASQRAGTGQGGCHSRRSSAEGMSGYVGQETPNAVGKPAPRRYEICDGAGLFLRRRHDGVAEGSIVSPEATSRRALLA